MLEHGLAQAVILAGGLGTRLRPLVPDRPKPMALFNGLPFLEYQLGFLKSRGVRDIVLCVGYMADTISGYFKDGGQWGLQIRYSVESTPMGTGGALKLAESLLSEAFFLLNGDTFLTCDLCALEKFHRNNRADMTLTACREADVARYGALEIEASGQVTAFLEKAVGGSPGYVNAGFSLVSKSLLADVPANRPVSLERDLLGQLVKTRQVYAFILPGGFVDIGSHEGYEQFARLVAAEPAIRPGTGARQDWKPA